MHAFAPKSRCRTHSLRHVGEVAPAIGIESQVSDINAEEELIWLQYLSDRKID